MSELKLRRKPKPGPRSALCVQGYSITVGHRNKISKLAAYYGINKSEVVRAMIDATDLPKGRPDSA